MLSSITEAMVFARDDNFLLQVFASVTALETVIFTPAGNDDAKGKGDFTGSIIK
jgi:hypothetical protein